MPWCKFLDAESEAAAVLQLFSDNVAGGTGGNFLRMKADITNDENPQQHAHNALYFLFGTVYQHGYNMRGRVLNADFDALWNAGGAISQEQRAVEAVVARAAAAIQADLMKSVAVDTGLRGVDFEDIMNRCILAADALEVWRRDIPHDQCFDQRVSGENILEISEKSSEKLETTTYTLPFQQQHSSPEDLPNVPSHNAAVFSTGLPELRSAAGGVGSVSTTAALALNMRSTFFNPSAFKRLPNGKSGQKHFEATEGVPMRYHMSQKKASRNGAAKKPTFTFDLTDQATDAQARMFSHSNAWEMSLTEPPSNLTVALVVIWERRTFRFPNRSVVEASVEVEVMDLGDLVALAVVFKDRAEQDVIDGGWASSDEKWEWDTGYRDLKTTVAYRRL